MTKILYLIESDDPGGAENVVLALVEYFKHKHPIIIGCLKRGWIYDQLLARGFDPKVIRTNKGPVDVRLLSHLIQLIKKEKVDLIHSHLFDINFYSSIAARITGVPHLCTEHGDIHHPSKTSRNNHIKPKILSICSHKIVFVSRYTQEAFCKISSVCERKSAVIYNGLDIAGFGESINVENKKMELGLRQEDMVVGNVGSLYSVKGQTYLLKAAKIVLQRLPNVKFAIIGRGGLEPELKEEARKLNISDNVLFLGFREDTHELLKVMHVFVLPSLSEAMPLSLIEAMACCLPCVASNVGGISEVIDDDLTGFTIPPADPQALADKITYLLKNPESAREIGKRAFHKVKANFDLQTMIDNYSVIYNEITQRTCSGFGKI